MPFMKPPHYQGISYNGRRIPEGVFVDVLPADVPALEAEGWELSALDPKPSKHADTDNDPED